MTAQNVNDSVKGRIYCSLFSGQQSAATAWIYWKSLPRVWYDYAGFLVEWWPDGFWIVLFFLHKWGWVIRRYAVPHCSSGLLCQTTYLWINLNRLSELSVSYQTFSIDNGALQVRRRLHSVCQTWVAADRRLESIADVIMKVVILCSSRVFFSRMYFWRSRGAASQPLSFLTGNLKSQGEWGSSEYLIASN